MVDGGGEGMDEHAAAAAAASAEAEKKKKTFRMRRLSMGGMAKKVNDDAPPPTEGTAPPPPPDDLADEIDAWNELIYQTINNGVYRAGFSTAQEAYETAVRDVFATLDNVVPATVDAGETVLRVRAFDTPDFALNPAVVYTNFLTYRPTGFINSPGNFVLCDSRGAAAARSIIINNTGRARFSRDVDDDGIHEDASNADLSC